MAVEKQAVFVGGVPWLEPGDPTVAKTSADICRGFLIVPFSEGIVTCDECKDPLPLVARWTDRDRRAWAKYELPRGESRLSQSSVYYSLPGTIETLTREVPLGAGISRSKLDEELELEEAVPNTHYAKIRDHIDHHTDFINDLYDSVRTKRYYWEGNCGGLAIRSAYRTAIRWARSEDRDYARLALIVKLAREISRTLSQVCEKPRVVLRRSREFQKISKIQEIDPACLRWLARQPGRDVYERAGSRQQLLGIVRKEDTDTLENRVVKDLLHRARVESANYISLCRDFKNHDRVKTVQRFRHHIIEWEKMSEIRNAQRITGPVQPNYVLLHESRYRKLWDAYQLLLSQQKQKDDIWKWRDRTFSESCEFGLLSLMRRYTKRTQFMRSDIAIRMESLTGKYVSSDTEFGMARLKSSLSNSFFLFCRGGINAQQCPFIPSEILPLAADFFLLVHRAGKPSRIVPVWCLAEAEESRFCEAIKLLEQKLSRISCFESIFPLVLVYENSTLERLFCTGRGRVANLVFPISKSIESLGSFIVQSLGMG